MDELYQLIEEKISASGYPGKIDGEEFYNDICDEADAQGEGAFLVLIKKSDLLSYEARVDVLEDAIDLHTCRIHFGEQVYDIDFDA
ncbi:MAG: hypothetical protein Q4B59_03265 [Lachnospiraceae bacterium]|nr:hypothetical protein [Lachnospiraceae bacterium]